MCMSREEKKEVIDLLTEAIHNSHQSKDREVSGLFREINTKMDNLSRNQDAIVAREEEFHTFVYDKLLEIEKKAVTWDLSSRGFLAMVGLAVTALFGAMVSFFIRT